MEYILGLLLGFAIGFAIGLSGVKTADVDKATTSTGLVVENKGFNVGDTLVIRKK